MRQATLSEKCNRSHGGLTEEVQETPDEGSESFSSRLRHVTLLQALALVDFRGVHVGQAGGAGADRGAECHKLRLVA